MSSRSFRRRNNRRKHNRQGGAGDQQGQIPRDPGSPQREAGQKNGLDDGRGRGQRPDQPGGRRTERGRDSSRRGADPVVPRPAQPLVFPDCPICRQPVRDLASALTHRETGQPAHFDCVMREIREQNEIAPQEKICYLGGGAFGVVDFRQPGSAAGFVIKKRIPYEQKETSQEWKKPLLISL